LVVSFEHRVQFKPNQNKASGLEVIWNFLSDLEFSNRLLLKSRFVALLPKSHFFNINYEKLEFILNFMFLFSDTTIYFLFLLNVKFYKICIAFLLFIYLFI